MRSIIKIKWLFFRYERIGTFFYRNKRKLIIKNKNINERVNYKIKNRKKKFLTKKRDTHILYNLLKSIKFEELYIEEKIGLLKPDVTALAIPFISIISMFPIKFLNINYDKFHYDINPYYSELKFNLTVETKISFRLIDIISCIIKEKMHKLFL